MPNRYIKESICVSEDYNALTPIQRDIFLRLIVKADDFGRYYGRPVLLKSHLAPLDNITQEEIDDGIRALIERGMVVQYWHENAPYLRLPAWRKHQTTRAKVSKFPADLNESFVELDTLCIHDKSIECKCARNRIRLDDNADCNICALYERACEIEKLYKELYPDKELCWSDVFTVSKLMLPFEMLLIRKALLLTYTSKVRNFVSYIRKIVEDWHNRGVYT
jgi:hypothetical protein